MPSFTSSSNLHVQVLLAFSRARQQILLTVVLVLLMGEVYMRLPFIPQRLEYEPDIELGVKLGANQVGYLWMADMSMPSPCMTINNEGHRGEETDWSKPVIL